MNEALVETSEIELEPRIKLVLLKIGLVLEKFSPFVVIDGTDRDLLRGDPKFKKIIKQYLGFDEIGNNRLKVYRDDKANGVSEKGLYLIRSDIANKDAIRIFKKYEDGVIIRDFLDRNGYSQMKILIK